MPIRIEDGGNLAIEMLGLIQKRGGLESRHNLIAQFTNPVSIVGFDGSQVFELRGSLHPSPRPTVENYIVQQVLAYTLCFGAPLRGISGCRERRDALEQMLPNLERNDVWRLQWMLQNRSHILGSALGSNRESRY